MTAPKQLQLRRCLKTSPTRFRAQVGSMKRATTVQNPTTRKDYKLKVTIVPFVNVMKNALAAIRMGQQSPLVSQQSAIGSFVVAAH